ncbi:Serine/threonine protein kinase [Acidisarcina polymorpha]|uniref:non-specific serine/threonine protein kinase n=1 Tax=Acidisarcina polymorpha TaxID=2211140 RepID=A0A2Z5G8S1_9BACT|nr:serine/threonine-protein kinase [Acidisarcina polymorpha]AXC15055.1 Serine/threonine protein kinase [Acidisarcina polymorpha]
MSFSVGDRIGEYEVVGTLGSGGIGQVYQVRHAISNRAEAMKVLLTDRAGTEEISERFLREIRVLASLDHPNIAGLHTAFHHQGQLVMIMEFVEGMTLRTKLGQGSIMMSQSLDYLRQILAGLAYAHRRGIVHRDIKPANIMVTPDERIKLLDFGLAFQGLRSDITRTGLILGSLHYMSPEQVMGERVDARSDIYSVGVTLYQLLTGRVPIDGFGEYAIASGHLKNTPEDPTSINPNIPSQLAAMVMKALAKAPEERFQTAQAFYDALGSLNSDETMSLLPTPALNREAHDSEARKTGATAQPAGAATGTRTLSGASVLAAVSRELAHYIGPIAKVVVNRAAKQAATLDELYALIGGEIGAETERKTFMATRQKYSV